MGWARVTIPRVHQSTTQYVRALVPTTPAPARGFRARFAGTSTLLEQRAVGVHLVKRP